MQHFTAQATQAAEATAALFVSCVHVANNAKTLTSCTADTRPSCFYTRVAVLKHYGATHMMRSFICRTRTVLSLRITVPDSTGLKVLSSRGMLLGQSVLF